MFNRRIKDRLTCLEIHVKRYIAYTDRKVFLLEGAMDKSGVAIKKLQHRYKQLSCEHKTVIFKAASPLGGPPNSKECADCGKILKYYKTKKEWLEEQLKEECKKAPTLRTGVGKDKKPK